MDLQQTIRGRRSIRKFRKEEVPRELLTQLVEAAIWAPSASNAQTWRFVIATEPKRIRSIKTVSPGLLGDPAAVIAVCQDLTKARERGGTLGETFLAPVDAAMATENLLLAAYAEGLGTCVIASFHRGAVGRVLGLPEGIEPMLLVSVGWPAEAPPAPSRSREGRVFFEVYNGSG